MPSLSRFFTRDWVVLLATMAVLAGCGQGGGEGQPKNEPAAAQSADVAPGSSDRAKNQTHPRVKIATSLGDIIVRLDGEKALLTVNNFLQYANAKDYDGAIFHEVNAGYVVLGGGYTQDLTPKPARMSVRNEAANGLKNVRGTIAMARDAAAIDSATNVFFINLADNAYLDHRDDTPEGYGYCVFGEVVEGMDVADRIGKLEVREAKAADGSPLPRNPVEPVVIKSVRVVQ